MIKTKNIYHHNLIYLLVFLLSITDALAGYTQSSFLNQFFSLSNIGLIIVFCSATTIIASTWLPKIINKTSIYKTGLKLATLAILCTLVLATAKSPWLIFIFFLIRYLVFIFLMVVLDIFLEKISQDKVTGFIRSIYLTIINLAWLSSPWLMGQLVGVNHYNRIYLVGSFVMSLFLLTLIINRGRLKNIKTDSLAKNINLLASLKRLKSNRNLLGIFSSVVVLNIFYAMAVLYIPIYLNISLGFSWQTIGLIFTFMLLPFIFLQFPAGLLADKYLGEKEMLITGNLLIAISSLVICFTNNNQIIFWAILLFASRIGAALTESMQEIYFYKQISVKNLSLINLFRQSRSLGWLLGALLAFVLLKFVAIPSLFLVITLIMCLNVLQLTFIKDTK